MANIRLGGHFVAWLVANIIVTDSLIYISLVYYLVCLALLFYVSSSFDPDLGRANEERAQLPWTMQ